MLSDVGIEKEISNGSLVITPYDHDQLQPASYDVRLGSEFQAMQRISCSAIFPMDRQPNLYRKLTLGTGLQQHYILHPGEFALGSTKEYVNIPDDLACQLSGKSSLGRLGLLVHATAGFVDPGFRGQITLELANVGTLPVVLEPGMLIGQLHFIRLDESARQPYNGRYQDQQGATISRYYENYE